METVTKYFTLKFIIQEQIAKDTFAFYFDRKNSKLSFLAGQYMHIYLPVVNEKGRGNSRMFTIASSPLEKDHIFIATKKGRTIYKKALFNLIPGTSVKFYGPSGGLVVDEVKKPSYVFLSLGIGITPFRSILKYVSQKNLKIPVTLIASFANKEDFCFYDELMGISKYNSNIKIIYTLTRIRTQLIEKYIKNINEHLYYIVGSPNAVSDLEEVVSEMGIPSDKIFTEIFEGY